MKPCNQCGKCCIKYANGGLSATEHEIQQWELYRPDIAKYVRNGQIWVHPEQGTVLTHCPWLIQQDNNKYGCAIYNDRPDDCKFYPSTIQEMISDACEMLETQDHNDLKRAQRQLNQIMSDSHQ